MDVTCNRCGTTYEFEEALISTTGTTVKCTHCGHLFKVRRRTLAPSGRPPDGEVEPARELRWRVRRVDGSTHLLESLNDLTPLIAAGQFARDDEISRTGQVWKKLGDIHELVNLFDGAAAARPRRASMEPPPPPPPAPPAIPSPVPPAGPSDAPRARHRSPPERLQPRPSDPVALDALEPPAARADDASPPDAAPAAAAGGSAAHHAGRRREPEPATHLGAGRHHDRDRHRDRRPKRRRPSLTRHSSRPRARPARGWWSAYRC